MSQLEAVLAATTEDEARKAFHVMRSELLELRAEEDFSGTGAFLYAMAVRGASVHPMLLVAGLRLTFLYRDNVARWLIARDLIAEHLRQRQMDPAELLVGLMVDELGLKLEMAIGVEPFDGDFGEGEVRLRDRIVTARREHACHNSSLSRCPGVVRKGEKHRVMVEAHRFDGITTFRWCQSCTLSMLYEDEA